MATLRITSTVSVKHNKQIINENEDSNEEEIINENIVNNEDSNEEEEEEIWEDLKICNKYEISRKYPYPIRNKKTGHILKDWDDCGYRRTAIHFGNRRTKFYKVHVLIANQWIPNDDPEHKKQIDHINRIKSDNHISNLRWISPSKNDLNKSAYNGYEAIWHKELPPTIEPFTEYYHHKFEIYLLIEQLKKIIFKQRSR